MTDINSTEILTVNNLSKSFGGIHAVNDLSFSIKEGDIHAVIGPNGAGKTTVFNLLTGLIYPDKGKVLFKDKEITSMRTDHVAKVGISRTYQNIRLFPEMTVFETVLMGTYLITGGKVLPALFLTKRFRDNEKIAKKKVKETLKFVGLWEVRDEYAANLSYGSQRIVEIARALAMDPKLLLLDEPTAGMNSEETKELMDLFSLVNKQGVTIFIIAHDMNLINTLSNQITVINFGEKLAEGPPEVIHNHPKVVEAYMGRTKENA